MFEVEGNNELDDYLRSALSMEQFFEKSPDGGIADCQFQRETPTDTPVMAEEILHFIFTPLMLAATPFSF